MIKGSYTQNYVIYVTKSKMIMANILRRLKDGSNSDNGLTRSFEKE